MLEIQKYLKSGKTPENLKEEFAIDFKIHKQFSNLYLFKYNMIDSPMGHPIVQEARGIILDQENNWNVVCHSFNKFFNYGEGHAATIDWKTARVTEKMDGSLIQIFNFLGQWRVASSGSPDATGQIHGLTGGSWEPRPGIVRPIPNCFEEYFWQIANLDSDIFSKLTTYTEYCFIFELMGSINRVVVNHSIARVVLLGARNLLTGKEITAKKAGEMLNNSFEVVREFPLTSFEEIIKSFEHFSGLEQEGYVVVDGNFNRVKMKSPSYLALHHLRDGLNTKSFVEIVRTGETSEVLNAFPEFRTMIDDAKQRLDALVLEIEKDYEPIKDIEVQKEFALKAVKSKCSGALFSLRGKKVNSIREYFNKMQIDHLLEYLGYK